MKTKETKIHGETEVLDVVTYSSAKHCDLKAETREAMRCCPLQPVKTKVI